MNWSIESFGKGVNFEVNHKVDQCRCASVPHAPVRNVPLSELEIKLAIQNALRYIPQEFHQKLATEFAAELKLYGHIYMYRYLPSNPSLRALPLRQYGARCRQCAAIMLMICNNLDPQVAQFPHELVTYGGNGQVFSNWAQFWLTMKYLNEMDDTQTLVLTSGHPVGLFPSHKDAPRLVITNGMMIPNYSTKELYDKYFALGVTMYGQMTAGSFCYIGPQGIVHGTTITLINAARRYLGTSDLSGKVFVTSGLGGMSGAQAMAGVIAGAIVVVAEITSGGFKVDPVALNKRFDQGWVMEKIVDSNKLVCRIKEARKQKTAVSIGFLGNIVHVWEKLVEVHKQTGELLVELGSDQTSCHNPFNGGYYPTQISFNQANNLMHQDPVQFKLMVQESLLRHLLAVDYLSSAGMHFWDYGNAFLLECHRAGAAVLDQADPSGTRFKYPSYVQHIMGDIFSMGFGPFRWVCTSGDPKDLKLTDSIARQVLDKLSKENSVPKVVIEQYKDNILWLDAVQTHDLVVGSQARILYSDQVGRYELAKAFNRAIANGQVGCIVLSRDHHDVSGTDSPFRETSNIEDGSAFTADMAVQNCIGDAFRGATWVSLHNGGGVGWGDVINGGFGLVLDGSQDAERRAMLMLGWDVSNGVSRRCWSGNPLAYEAISRAMRKDKQLKVTLPNHVHNEDILDQALHIYKQN